MRTIRGYPLYKIDRYGVVHGMRTQIKQIVNRFGIKHVPLYRWVDGCRKGKCHEVHRLVARAFLPGTAEPYHVNGDKGDNRLANLKRGKPPEKKIAPMFYLTPTAPRPKWVPPEHQFLLEQT